MIRRCLVLAALPLMLGCGSQPSIVGNWDTKVSFSDGTITFLPNGKLRLGNSLGSYSLKNGRLSIAILGERRSGLIQWKDGNDFMFVADGGGSFLFVREYAKR